MATWLTHLDFDWESPIWRPWLDELSRDFFLVRYDPRGCGLSDWSTKEISFEAWVRDLAEVVSAADVENFTLLGLSQGGPIGIEYSLRHPEMGKSIVVWGGFGVGWIKRERIPEEEREALYTITREGWGRESAAYRSIFTNLFFPDASEEQTRWFNELQRKSMSAENALAYLTEAGNIDVSDKLAKVCVPTLIVHSREDVLVPYEEGRYLAASIPNARLVTLESRNHIVLEKEEAWQTSFSEIRRFCEVEETEGRREPIGPASEERRKLAVVMFVDLVAYTAIAQRNEPLALSMVTELGSMVRPIFQRFAGREVKTIGDAFLLEFGSALDATKCALSVQDALRSRNISMASQSESMLVRIGIHLGDVEENVGDILGDAVNIASRLQSIADPGGICVSQQLYDQIRNRNEFSFERIGRRRLKNVREPLMIYKVTDSSK